MTTFKEMAHKNDKALMLTDGLNLAFRWKHSKSTKFVDEYIRTVQSLAQSYKCGKVIICCDSGSSAYRKAIYPEYKMNRKEKYAEQTEQEAEEFAKFFEEFNRTMGAIEEFYPVLRFDKTEADDIAAYIVQQRHNYNIEETWLISSDADWKLLIAEDVSKFSYVTRKEDTYNNWESNHDHTIEEFLSVKVLMGDSGDNIMGVEGIGPKRAVQLVKEYGSAYDIVAALPIQSKYKYIQNLNKAGDLILLNYKLMDIATYCAEAIGPDNCKIIDTKLQQYLKDI